MFGAVTAICITHTKPKKNEPFIVVVVVACVTAISVYRNMTCHRSRQFWLVELSALPFAAEVGILTPVSARVRV